VEAGVVLVIVAGAAIAIYFLTVHPTHNSRPLGGENINVSPIVGAQTEASITVDPANPRVLLVGTNDDSQPLLRAYESTDEGRRWVSTLGPPIPGESSCTRGHPAVAIDRAGREYATYIVATYNTRPSTPVFCSNDSSTRLQIAVRDGPHARWHAGTVPAPSYRYGFDDKPAIAVTASGRVYLAWSRLFSDKYETTVLNHSDDHGKTWSQPAVVSRSLQLPQLVTLATRGKTLYVAGVDARRGIWITRTLDGTHFEPLRTVTALRANLASGCSIASGHPLAEQASQCTGPNPTIVVSRGRVVVTYGDITSHAAQAVYAIGLDPSLHRVLFRTARVGLPASSTANQFWPTAAVDPTDQVFWLCYYDTSGSSNKRRAWFTCSASRNGRVWAAPVRASSQDSLADSILADAYSYGGYVSVVAAHGVAHPAWIDTRAAADDEEDVFTAAIPTTRVLH
jgi:hypothetical protein